MLNTKAGVARLTRVLVVDDDPDMQRMVANYLEANSIQVAVASGRQEMARLLVAQRFNLVILDLRLGQDDGLDLLRELRTQSDMPVIITTGHRRDEIDRVVGLELGADDYVTKPFSLRELLARIRVVLRRIDAGRQEPRVAGQDTLRFGRWTLDRRTRRLAERDSLPIALTKGEYAREGRLRAVQGGRLRCLPPGRQRWRQPLRALRHLR